MTRKDRRIEKDGPLPAQERKDAVEVVLDPAVPRLSAEQERGLIEALDEADRGELVDGREAIAKLRRRIAERVGNNKPEPE